MSLTVAGRPRAGWAGLVRLSTRVIPRGPTRDRFQQELVAEMYGLTPQEQRGHALSVAVHAWSLRAAAAGAQPTVEETAMKKPLRCLVGRHHDTWTSTEDGERYRRCDRCGRDRIGPRGSGDWAAPIGL